jgi:hypothetical protein
MSQAESDSGAKLLYASFAESHDTRYQLTGFKSGPQM